MRLFAFATVALLLATTPLCHSAEPDFPTHPWDGSPGYCLYAGSISPDGAYEFAWAPTGLSPEVRATLTEWPADMEIDSAGDLEFDSFLFDTAHRRLLVQLPAFTFFEGQGLRKNRGELFVAWAPDSYSVLVISQERWDDEGILFLEPAANRIFDVKNDLENGFKQVLRTRKKDDTSGVNLQFGEPALLAGGTLVVVGDSGHMKEGPYYTYLLTFHVRTAGDKTHLDLAKAREISAKEPGERFGDADYDGKLNYYYGKLRARLDDKARAVLKKEELDWLQWRDSQPERAREHLTERRAAELRARAEN